LSPDIPLQKPKAILNAERALWLWTIWMCVFGIFQTKADIPDIEEVITTQLQGMVSISPQAMLVTAVCGYAVLALISIWIIFKIGAGKNWARASLLGGFALDLTCTLWSSYHDITGYLTGIPDLGLQIFAITMLYTAPGSLWFQKPKTVPAQAAP